MTANYIPVGHIAHSSHRAKKEYVCADCQGIISPGERYTHKSEKINAGYWHKTRICGKCKTLARVTLKNTRMEHVNRPMADEYWVAIVDDDKPEVIELGKDYYKTGEFYQCGSDVTLYNRNETKVKFIRKVFIDD